MAARQRHVHCAARLAMPSLFAVPAIRTGPDVRTLTGRTVTFAVTAATPLAAGQLIQYGGNLLIEPTATGTLTVTAHPGWRQGPGDVNYAITAQPTNGSRVVSDFDSGTAACSTVPVRQACRSPGRGPRTP
jgi:hypothetical protein